MKCYGHFLLIVLIIKLKCQIPKQFGAVVMSQRVKLNQKYDLFEIVQSLVPLCTDSVTILPSSGQSCILRLL